jgi:hypothetical protein
MHTFEGGCHCGAVRFRVDVDDDQEIIDCNGSICTKKGILPILSCPSTAFPFCAARTGRRFTRSRPGQRNTFFCKTCGIHPFYRPPSHPTSWDVNARCLDDVGVLSRFAVKPFDGQNWGANVRKLR